MFLWNLEKCLQQFEKVVVSTDDIEIAKLTLASGGMVVMRSELLCGDTPNIPVYQHAIKVIVQDFKVDAFVAVQANSPTVTPTLIYLVKKILELNVPEVMTCHPNNEIYGSIWAMTVSQLEKYGDPYKPTPVVRIVDDSIDIHTEEDFQKALCQR